MIRNAKRPLWLAIHRGRSRPSSTACCQRRWIVAQPAGNARMQEIAAATSRVPGAYLNASTAPLPVVGAVLSWCRVALDWYTAVGFALGALLSGAAGYIA